MTGELREKIEEICTHVVIYGNPTFDPNAWDKLIDFIEIYQAQDHERIARALRKYQCDFNWDFEKDRAKHKSYIALDTALAIMQGTAENKHFEHCDIWKPWIAECTCSAFDSEGTEEEGK